MKKKIKWYNVIWKYENSKEVFSENMDSIALNNMVVNDAYIEILAVNEI